ncbi:MAG: SMC-Scp complex subunit ScpB [Candidatus Woesearchaeota archaeon]
MAEVKGVKEAEAVLFASGKAMEEDRIKDLTGLKPAETKKALEGLKEKYDQADSALFIWNEGTRWKINVRERYVELVKSLVAETDLPKAILETLAIIAYRSPIMQTEVIKTRGEGAYEHVKELVDRGFITKERFGRSYKLKIADKFYHYFDVEGDKDIREAFAKAKKPDVQTTAEKEQKKLGELPVVEAESDEEHEQRRKDTQLEVYNITKQREDDKKNYLNDFEDRLKQSQQRVDEAEEDILKQKQEVEERKKEEGTHDEEELSGTEEAEATEEKPAQPEKSSEEKGQPLESEEDADPEEDLDDPQNLVSKIDKDIEELTKDEK